MLQAGILERLVSPPATPKGEEGHDRELTTPAGWSGLSSAAVSVQDPPMSLAATVEPTMAERLGAMRDMRLSTYLSMCSLASLRVSIMSHASNTRSTSSCSTFCLGGGGEGVVLENYCLHLYQHRANAYPWVVDAVTETTITVAAGRIS